MSLLDSFARVSPSHPCPVCGKSDWCLVDRTDPDYPSRAICARTESNRRWGDAGWLHVLQAGKASRRVVRRRASRVLETTSPDLAACAERFECAVDPRHLASFAAELGVTVVSLQRLHVGWTGSAWAFPMSDAHGRVRGVRLRHLDGTKRAVRGGKEGLFIPHCLGGGDRLLVAEGPTDTAALLDLGFDTVGRPSCRGGTRLVVELARLLRPPSLVVVPDRDEPGRQGAASLASVLIAYAPEVRVIEPPEGVADARDWVRSGATRRDVQATIDAAPPRTLGVRIGRGGRGRG